MVFRIHLIVLQLMPLWFSRISLSSRTQNVNVLFTQKTPHLAICDVTNVYFPELCVLELIFLFFLRRSNETVAYLTEFSFRGGSLPAGSRNSPLENIGQVNCG